MMFGVGAGKMVNCSTMHTRSHTHYQSSECFALEGRSCSSSCSYWIVTLGRLAVCSALQRPVWQTKADDINILDRCLVHLSLDGRSLGTFLGGWGGLAFAALTAFCFVLIIVFVVVVIIVFGIVIAEIEASIFAIEVFAVHQVLCYGS